MQARLIEKTFIESFLMRFINPHIKIGIHIEMSSHTR